MAGEFNHTDVFNSSLTPFNAVPTSNVSGESWPDIKVHTTKLYTPPITAIHSPNSTLTRRQMKNTREPENEITLRWKGAWMITNVRRALVQIPDKTIP